MDRRRFLGRSLAGAVGAAGTLPLAACGGGDDAESGSRTYLLVHGAWHNALHWSRVAQALSDGGHRVVALNLPGNGLDAELPASYISQDLGALATDLSPVRDVTLAQQASLIVDEIRRLSADGPVVAVAHSAGGLALTLAAEEVPDLVHHAVYVAAHCPVVRVNMVSYLGLPENASAQLGATFVGDFGAIGAVRINPRSSDATYQEALRVGFYNDLSSMQAQPFVNLLTPDLPLHIAVDEVRPTAQRWGRIPRTYVRTLRDQALPLALQDLMIAEADALTPQNRFTVYSLDSGHSPFASRPDELAAMLATVG